MELKVESRPVTAVEADAVAIVGFEGGPPQGAPAADQIKELYDSGEFSGKSLEIAVLHRPAGLKAKRLVIIGGGKHEKFDAALQRKVAGAVLRSLKSKGARSIALVLSDPFQSDHFASAAAEGAVLAEFEPNHYKTDPKKNDKRVDSFAILGGSESAVNRGRIIGEAQNYSRSLINEPGNVLTPMRLAEHASQMAAEFGLECEVLDQDRLKQMGMNSILAVAMGSAEPPALIVIRYKPAGAAAGGHQLGLVGKGVTFDTGGISIKPAESMDKMRYDMAGGAAVLGAMRIIAQLKPSLAVTGIVPTVENMPGSRALRPGDIFTSYAGKTIEVLNTDAEGRLILIDALAYARKLGCTHLIDAATLTGAIVVALGSVHVGAFTNNEEFLAKVILASKAAGEKMWHMPLDEEYMEALKSDFADLHNIGGRPGGAITAAMFLRDFVDDTPWVHLDIAGSAWVEDTKSYIAKGATGIGVRTFAELALNFQP